MRNMALCGKPLFIALAGVLFLLLAVPHPVMAIQPHGDPEGIVVHQFSHVFFIFSMAILIYWLHNRKLSVQPGWREIRYAALFLILWSMDAFAAHMLDEQPGWISTNRMDTWTMHVESSRGGVALAWLYYIVKLDHLLCVPALFFLYRGLARLSSQKDSGGEPDADVKREGPA
ncbi:MAG: hypothetical protein ACQEQN_10140 [Thermodesulfobacteriota bacterium]